MAFQNRSVSVHQFAMIPKSDIPRSSFRIEKMHKTTIDAGYLYPIYVDEVLPGDSMSLKMTIFGRLATPIFPFIDNLYLDSFFFFVPNRLLWDNWVRFMGEQDDPGDSISFVVPTITSNMNGFAALSIYDYMGLPTVGQVTNGETFTCNTLPLRAYNLIWNEWFRDENIQDSVVVNTDDGPDALADYTLLKRGKRKDYFTGALPFPQKGPSVSLPLGTTAPVRGTGESLGLIVAPGTPVTDFGGLVTQTAGGLFTSNAAYNQALGASPGGAGLGGDQMVGVTGDGSASGMVADLSAATAATINQLRQSFQIQRLLERDARGGTRYTELVRAHFGVISPDARLQRPEYLGGGSQRIAINPIAQTSETSAETPQGNLAAIGTVLLHGHGFSQSFTEHGIIVGMIMVRADLNYQQGLRKMWSRSTRYDFYFPAFAHLGEQAILTKEIYATGAPVVDDVVFGYQERWAEYRYNPSLITGLFKSTTLNTIDPWHLAQRFTAPPTLDEAFIEETPPLSRVLAVGTAAGGQQLLIDAFFSCRAARPMPMYSVPGLIDHF